MNKKLIKESIQDVLNDMGYYQQDDGSWKHKKTDKILSDKHAQDIAGERAAREPKRKKEETTAAGLNPTDKDARKPGEESTRSESFDLFPKNDERLLREYIREQYEARGIYPTAREVQETYNQVMSLLEVSAEEKARRKALRYGGENKRQARRKLRTGRPDDSGNVPQFFKDEGERQAAHSAARGRRKVSPSSPARKQSPVEVATRKTLGRGISSEELQNEINKLRETNR